MSYFIANTISFSKDLKTFKVKGGDNNVVPRSNYWTNSLPISKLYYHINGGMIQLNESKEKSCFVNYLVETTKYDGDYYDDFIGLGDKLPKGKFKTFNEKFEKLLVDGLINLSNKKEYIVKLNEYGFISKKLRSRSMTTRNVENAQRFSKYKALSISSKYSESKSVKNPK